MLLFACCMHKNIDLIEKELFSNRDCYIYTESFRKIYKSESFREIYTNIQNIHI